MNYQLGGATFAKSHLSTCFTVGKSIECFARAIEHNETVAAPRLAEYVRHFHASSIGIKADTTEEMFNELVIKAAKTYPIVAIRPRSSIGNS